MATQKSVPLPWIKKVSSEEDTADSFERRRESAVIDETVFVHMLRFERRRTERSGKSFMLALVSGGDLSPGTDAALIHNVVTAISSSTRETDILGWYKRNETLGLLMTEIVEADASTVNTLIQKISGAVQGATSPSRSCRLKLTFRVFPQDTAEIPADDFDVILYSNSNSGSHQSVGAAGPLRRRFL